MPLNFAEVWLNRVRRNISTSGVAPWLDGIPEIDTTVIEMGSGDASESNVIHIPNSSFKPEVLINNTTYPIALQAYTDSESIVQLDKYQTKVTTLSDDQVIGASYDRIDTATRTHTEAITEKKYAKAIHALAPAANTANTPVIQTTGATIGTRKKLIYDDLVTLKGKCDDMQMPVVGRRLVLSSDHWNDLLSKDQREFFGDAMVNFKEGEVAPRIAGFDIYQYIDNPYYNVTAKVTFGAVPPAGAFRGSVAFSTSVVIKKTGLTKQYFQPAKNDPENQTNKLNYRHYFIAVPAELKYIGAIASTSV